MVPGSLIGVVIFMLFVVPGSCLELLRERKSLPYEESTFVHISRILLAGTFISAAALSTLCLTSLINPSAVLDFPKLITQGTAYVSSHLTLVSRTAIAQLILSTLIAIIVNDLRTARSASLILRSDAWHAMSEHAVNRGKDIGVSVHLKSGRDILGYYVGSSTELEPAKRELIVGAPLSAREAGHDKAIPLGKAWQRMVIPGVEIESVAFCHIGATIPEKLTYLGTKWAWLRERYLEWPFASVLMVVVIVILLVI